MQNQDNQLNNTGCFYKRAFQTLITLVFFQDILVQKIATKCTPWGTYTIYIHVDLYPNQTRTFQFIQFLFACHWQFSCQLRHFNTTLLIIDLQKYLIQLSNGQLISFSSILQDLDIFENDKVILAFQIARLNIHSGREDGRQNYFHLFQ